MFGIKLQVFMKHFFPLFVVVCFYACTKNTMEVITDNTKLGQKILPSISLVSVSKLSSGINNSSFFDGKYHPGQGVAVHDSVLVRLFDTGLCERYDLVSLESPLFQTKFPLGSYESRNHGNCAQFYYDSKYGHLLYVSGLRGKCFVECIGEDSSELLQTITLSSLKLFNNSQNLNIVCGDDGYLWAFGDSRSNGTLYFAKLRRPSVDEGDVVLGRSDVLDYWKESGYIYKESVWQGGKVYKGLLFFVFGTKDSRSHISIYDTKSHLLASDLDLQNVVLEEPEDCDIIDNCILLTIAGGKGYYLIETEINQ